MWQIIYQYIGIYPILLIEEDQRHVNNTSRITNDRGGQGERYNNQFKIKQGQKIICPY